MGFLRPMQGERATVKTYLVGVAGILLAAVAIAPPVTAQAAQPPVNRAHCARLYDRLSHATSQAQHDRILIRGAIDGCFVLD